MAAVVSRVAAVLAAVACTVLAACGAAGDSTQPTEPTAPTESTAPTAPTAPTESTQASGLLVLPQQPNGFPIAGQHVVFLVAAGSCEPPITITADATNATTTVLEPTISESDDVTEVVVVPDPGSTGSAVTVTILGTAGAVTEQSTVSFDVVDGEDDRAAHATQIRDLFVPWLAANRAELGITETTTWQGTMVSPQWLVVSHYLFFSAEWEMHVEWHIMVAPDDWARIDLRRRFVETTPSEAFEISSVTQGREPHPYDVPESVWR